MRDEEVAWSFFLTFKPFLIVYFNDVHIIERILIFLNQREEKCGPCRFLLQVQTLHINRIRFLLLRVAYSPWSLEQNPDILLKK